MASEVTFTGQSGATWRYWPGEPLGRPGGFGAVYAAQAEDGTPMAVKVVDRQRHGPPLDDRLLRREVDIGRRVAESGSGRLVPVVDAAENNKALMLVMARADRALSDLPTPMDETTVITVLTDVAAGLQDLHALAIIHRDLKPANILAHDGRWKLADFGIAHDQEIGTQSATFAGFGSSPYMAPELWELKSPTIKTDLYALGCLAFELLAGSPPYPGDLGDARAGHLMRPPPIPPTSNSMLRDLVTRLIAKGPGDRPQDARAVLDRLSRARARRTPSQENIARSFARATSDNEQAAAYAAWAAEDAEVHTELAAQGKAELLDIFRDAFEELKPLDPAAAFWPGRSDSSATSAICALSADWARLQVATWPGVRPRPPGDPVIVTGWVYITNRHFNPDLQRSAHRSDGPPPGPGAWGAGQHYGLCSANLVYLPIGGRFSWQIYRFARKYRPRWWSELEAPQPHPLPDWHTFALGAQDFHGYLTARMRPLNEKSLRRWMDSVPAPRVTGSVTSLTAATALGLFQEAIDLRRPSG